MNFYSKKIITYSLCLLSFSVPLHASQEPHKPHDASLELKTQTESPLSADIALKSNAIREVLNNMVAAISRVKKDKSISSEAKEITREIDAHRIQFKKILEITDSTAKVEQLKNLGALVASTNQKLEKIANAMLTNDSWHIPAPAQGKAYVASVREIDCPFNSIASNTFPELIFYNSPDKKPAAVERNIIKIDFGETSFSMKSTGRKILYIGINKKNNTSQLIQFTQDNDLVHIVITDINAGKDYDVGTFMMAKHDTHNQKIIAVNPDHSIAILDAASGKGEITIDKRAPVIVDDQKLEDVVADIFVEKEIFIINYQFLNAHKKIIQDELVLYDIQSGTEVEKIPITGKNILSIDDLKILSEQNDAMAQILRAHNKLELWIMYADIGKQGNIYTNLKSAHFIDNTHAICIRPGDSAFIVNLLDKKQNIELETRVSKYLSFDTQLQILVMTDPSQEELILIDALTGNVCNIMKLPDKIIDYTKIISNSQFATIDGTRCIITNLKKLVCANCKSGKTKLLNCSGCKNIYYCSKECQRAHWKKEHKFKCVAQPEQRKALESAAAQQEHEKLTTSPATSYARAENSSSTSSSTSQIASSLVAASASAQSAAELKEENEDQEIDPIAAQINTLQQRAHEAVLEQKAQEQKAENEKKQALSTRLVTALTTWQHNKNEANLKAIKQLRESEFAQLFAADRAAYQPLLDQAESIIYREPVKVHTKNKPAKEEPKQKAKQPKNKKAKQHKPHHHTHVHAPAAATYTSAAASARPAQPLPRAESATPEEQEALRQHAIRQLAQEGSAAAAAASSAPQSALQPKIELSADARQHILSGSRQGGMHHDYLKTSEKQGKILPGKHIDAFGSYWAQVQVGNQANPSYQQKSLFPSKWSQEQVIETIQHALQQDTIQETLVDPETGNTVCLSIVNPPAAHTLGDAKMTIITVKKPNGDLITAYPWALN